tara:strand:+ start:239 stop:982 length:744 start_codon:yes stop_codon:yes gene_type:complete
MKGKEIGNQLKTLHLFGDSFTYGTGCNMGDEYYERWRNIGDAMWGEILAHKLSAQYKNYGIQGASNDYIFDSIINPTIWDTIKKDDIVIIGKSFTARFDIPDNLDETSTRLDSINTAEMTKLIDSLHPDKFKGKEWDKLEVNPMFKNYNHKREQMLKTVVNWHHWFSWNDLYKKRHDLRFDYIEKMLVEKGCKVIIWGIESDFGNLETIARHTKNQIADGHWSFKAHRIVANTFYERIIGERQQTAI